MIFVSVGTNEAPFDRLLRAVAALPTDERLVDPARPLVGDAVPRAELVDFLPFEEMGETIRQARAFVTHAGVGSIMVALANGKRPIVVPRRKAFGEAVDDHQLQLGLRFAHAGLVTLVEEPDVLGDALAGDQAAESVVPDRVPLAAELRPLPRACDRSPPRCPYDRLSATSIGSTRIRSGVAWKAASQITLQVSRMVVALILARLLAPERLGARGDGVCVLRLRRRLHRQRPRNRAHPAARAPQGRSLDGLLD